MSKISAVAALALAWTPSARAQSTEDIIVTAPKRGGASAQDVPITMNVFDEAAIRSFNVEDLQSLSFVMPNVQLEDIGTARGIANFAIRGVGVNSSIASVDPAVGVFLDGMYVGLNAGAISDLFDVEAIEVLRGPQGALYGRNVSGGAILVRTNRPTESFEARARVAGETGPNFTTQLSLSGPLAPGILSARLAVLEAHDEGWFRNGFNSEHFGESETSAVRASLRFTPAMWFDATLRVEQGYSDGDGPAGQNHALHARSSFDFAIDNPGYAATDWEQAVLEANWRVPFGNGEITSISAWRHVVVPWAADIDSTTAFVFHTRVLNEQSQRSEELRYAGTFGALSATAGLYYLEQDLLYIDERNFSPTFRRTGGGQGEFRTWAAFANADWLVAPSLTLGAGLRYTHEEKESRISRVRRAIDDLDGPGVIVPGEGVDGGSIDAGTLSFSDSPISQAWDDLSPRLGLQWRPSETTNVYASWSRAFRGGGANFRASTLGIPPQAYDPEEQSTFEIGLKQDLSRARVNIALFHNSIENMQRETNQADPISGVQQIVLNAGDSTIWGGEIEARLYLTDTFSVMAHAGYLHGAYDRVTEDLNGDLAVDGRDLDLKIPRLAPWTYGVNIFYAAPIWDGEAALRLGYNHRDPAYYNDTNFGRLAEADIVDANFSFAPANANWRVAVYGENLTDDPSWGGDTTLPSTPAFGFSGGERPTFSPLNKGRVIGIELEVRY